MRTQDWISELEILLRENQDAKVCTKLKQLKAKGIPRADLSKFANLARRVGLVPLSLEVLAPIVNESSKAAIHTPASPIEMAEYAMSINQVGAQDDAKRILGQIDIESYPKALFYMAMVLISQWNYVEAEQWLKKYLLYVDSKSYEALISRLNLCTCYFQQNKFSLTQSELAQLLVEGRQQKMYKLAGHALEISAQVRIELKDFEMARNELSEANSILADGNPMFSLIVEKWLKLINLHTEGLSESHISGLWQVRSKALQIGHWESVRDCDQHVALLSENESLFLHVYFGSPFPAYKSQILSEFPTNLQIPNRFMRRHFEYDPDDGSAENIERINRRTHWRSKNHGHPKLVVSLTTEDWQKQEFKIQPDGLLRRLFISLNKDFYRPSLIGDLFHDLYPDQHFDPRSAFGRVHQLLFRFRKWLVDEKLPFRLLEDNGAYRITSTVTDVALEAIPWGSQMESSLEERRLHALSESFHNRPFSAKEAAKILQLSKPTVCQLLNLACTEGKIEKIGVKQTQRYIFKSAS